MNVHSPQLHQSHSTTLDAPVWTMPGFGPMTRITTSFGDVPSQALRERDTLRGDNGAFVLVTKVDRYVLEANVFEKCPDATPILIRAGAFGKGMPKADVIVSPAQEIGIGATAASARFFKASALLGRPGVLRKPESLFTYTRVYTARPTVVKTEGLWARIGPRAVG